MQAAELVIAYLNCRDQIEALKKKHKDELAPFNIALDKMESGLLALLDRDGLQRAGAKLPDGSVATYYKKLETSTSVADWEAAFGFIQSTKRWDFLERRMNKTAVLGYMEEHNGEPPPGVNVSQAYGVGVQRG